MRMSTLLLVLPFLSAAAAVSSRETPECQVRVLSAVKDDMGRSLTAGTLVPTDVIRRDESGTSYCAHGGSCVPQMAGGVQVAKLVNCRVGKAVGDGYLAVVPDPATMSAATFAQMNARARAERRLSDLGFSNASAGSHAEAYASAPSSAEGRLVARVLAGSASALATLRRQDAR